MKLMTPMPSERQQQEERDPEDARAAGQRASGASSPPRGQTLAEADRATPLRAGLAAGGHQSSSTSSAVGRQVAPTASPISSPCEPSSAFMT